MSVGSLNGYFGQAGFENLRTHCDSGIEYITLAFVNQAPENYPSNYPGTNFGGHCLAGSFITEEGVVSGLMSECVDIQGDIPYCQEQGVKILLSIGGVYDAVLSDYEVTTDDNAEYFAAFLYMAFGPYSDEWTGPRPFDTEDAHAAVDGFDFDIEEDFANGPYTKMIETFRSLDSDIIITGAPQCPTKPDYFYMKEMIQDAAFDALFIQFYNNPVCDAITGNNNGAVEKFNYDDWVDIVDASSKSQTAKIFVGLPASTDAAGSGYLTPTELKDLVCELSEKPHFGGISLWDLTRGVSNVIDGKDYNTHAAEALQYGCAPIPEDPATTTTAHTTTGSVTGSVSVTTTSAAVTTATTTTTPPAGVSTTDSTTSGAAATTTTKGSIPSHGWNGTTTAAPTITSSSVHMTTSTHFTTSVHTVTKCPPWVKHCPAGGYVTTETIALWTTVCPYSGETAAPTAPTTKGPSGPMTTSTVFTTKVHTITKCPSYVVDCPVGQVSTETIPLYTTVCPVSEAETATEVVPVPAPTGPAGPGSPSAPGEEEESTTKTEVTQTISTTIVVGPSSAQETTATVPAGGSPSKPSSGFGCSGPGCPGAAIPSEGWTSVPPSAAPTAPVTAGASALAAGLTGLVALVAAQVFVL